MKLPVVIALAVFTASIAAASIASAVQHDTVVKCGDDDEKKDDKS
jgi:hypothetical protein